MKDEFPVYEVDCCVTDPDCEDHSPKSYVPRGAPKLRFSPGDRVLCNYGEWVGGTITGLWYREDDWPRGQYAPYQVRLDNGDMICAPNDNDESIKAADAAEHKKQPSQKVPELRFAIGDRVLCNCGEEWKGGTITGHYYREDDWPRGEYAPYQVRLDAGNLICAPSDNDGCIKAEPAATGVSAGKRSSKRLKDAAEDSAKD